MVVISIRSRPHQVLKGVTGTHWGPSPPGTNALISMNAKVPDANNLGGLAPKVISLVVFIPTEKWQHLLCKLFKSNYSFRASPIYHLQ